MSDWRPIAPEIDGRMRSSKPGRAKLECALGEPCSVRSHQPWEYAAGNFAGVGESCGSAASTEDAQERGPISRNMATSRRNYFRSN